MTVASPVRWFPRGWPSSAASAAAVHRFNPSDFSPPIRTWLLILQPTPFCNIACDYCYLPDRNSSARMGMLCPRTAPGLVFGAIQL